VRLLVLALFLVLSSSAQAANWLKNCQGTGAASQSLQPGNFACNVPTSSTDNSSGILDVTACGDFDVLFFDDADGDTVLSGGTGTMRSCPTTGLSTADGGAGIAACEATTAAVLDGLTVPTSTTYGLGANWIFWEQVAYTTPAEPVRVIVRCNQ
jgi:hypothetical protein